MLIHVSTSDLPLLTERADENHLGRNLPRGQIDAALGMGKVKVGRPQEVVFH